MSCVQLSLLILQLFYGYHVDAIGSLVISPPGPILVPLGATVVVNCSLSPPADKNNKLLTWSKSAAPQREVLWIDDVLQLRLKKVSYQDAGLYSCQWQDYDAVMEQYVIVWIKAPDPGKHWKVNISTSCGLKHFECASGHCIFARYRCDNIVDCPEDDSDEINCSYRSCLGKFRCENGQCINRTFVCDKHDDCRDTSDEKYCNDQGKYDPPGLESTVKPYPVTEHDHNSWHFNAVYSAVAGVIGLVCVVAIVIVTVCRIHMRREALSQMAMSAGSSRGRGRPITSRPPRSNWHQASYNHPSLTEMYASQRFIPPPNVSLNINVHLTSSDYPGLRELSSLLPSPPPYSEVDEMPREDSPPPPYSRLAHTDEPDTLNTTPKDICETIHEEDEDGDIEERRPLTAQQCQSPAQNQSSIPISEPAQDCLTEDRT